MRKILLIALPIILMGVLVSGLLFMYYDGWQKGYERGWLDGYDAFEPKEFTVTRTIEAPPIVREVEVVKEVRIPCEFREFEDIRDIGRFLKSLNVDEHQQPDWDCDDYAMYVWIEALKAGYLMSFESEWKGEILHALNSTVIGNNVYHIEPQQGKIWLFGYLD